MNSRIVILCPGPSLATQAAETWRRYDSLITVNRALLAAVWRPRDAAGSQVLAVIHDAHTAEWLVEAIAAVRPRIVTTAAQRRRMCPAVISEGLADWLMVEDLRAKQGRIGSLAWWRWGWSTAVVAAWALATATGGAGEIDCYGMDWSGGEDFDGFTDAHQRRDADRWAREREEFDRLAEWLAGQGMTLGRVA